MEDSTPAFTTRPRQKNGAVILVQCSCYINDGASTPAAGATEATQVDDVIAFVSTPDCTDDINYARTPTNIDTF
ncbi:hypothetical protein EVAR_17208_1 [Eumeta japonica]|uniref:Uncharacterized protein n=1 Tax=Eumeta variegata TaxID=151549 RepID=A0A4C1UAD9_EUMVA|nr:hypothetical protein EVAR_17208_1 [Eumeta japonica]